MDPLTDRPVEPLVLAGGFLVASAACQRACVQITCTLAGLVLLLHWIMQGVNQVGLSG